MLLNCVSYKCAFPKMDDSHTSAKQRKNTEEEILRRTVPLPYLLHVYCNEGSIQHYLYKDNTTLDVVYNKLTWIRNPIGVTHYAELLQEFPNAIFAIIRFEGDKWQVSKWEIAVPEVNFNDTYMWLGYRGQINVDFDMKRLRMLPVAFNSIIKIYVHFGMNNIEMYTRRHHKMASDVPALNVSNLPAGQSLKYLLLLFNSLGDNNGKNRIRIARIIRKSATECTIYTVTNDDCFEIYDTFHQSTILGRRINILTDTEPVLW